MPCRASSLSVTLMNEEAKNMSRDDIIETLTEIMCDLFDLDDLDYADSLTADDVEEWDSLSHVRFVVAVEKESMQSPLTKLPEPNCNQTGNLSNDRRCVLFTLAFADP